MLADNLHVRKYVYFFGPGQAEGDENMREVLGGKGAGLAGITRSGLPAPPGSPFPPRHAASSMPTGITCPEITEMQVRAIMEAACALKKEGVSVAPEIMIPLVGVVGENFEQKNTRGYCCPESPRRKRSGPRLCGGDNDRTSARCCHR